MAEESDLACGARRVVVASCAVMRALCAGHPAAGLRSSGTVPTAVGLPSIQRGDPA